MGYSAIVLPQLKPYMDGGKEWYPHYRPFVIDEEQGSWIGESKAQCLYLVTLLHFIASLKTLKDAVYVLHGPPYLPCSHVSNPFTPSQADGFALILKSITSLYSPHALLAMKHNYVF